MTSSLYLDREEELLLDRLAGVNRLSRNSILRLALRELAALADPAGRLPLLGRRPVGVLERPEASRSAT